MEDVAAKVGVSRALVSLVFRNAPGASQETRDRVFAAAEELGYRPDSAARLLASSRSRVLGVMMTVRNPFHSDLVEAIYPEAERLGYDILLSASAPTRGEHKAIEALLGHRCEALILLGPDTDAAFLGEVVRRAPVVSVGRRIAAAGVDSVHTAEAKGVRLAIDHLVGLGHRRIVHIDGGSGAGSAERRRGYRASMRRHGLAEEVRVVPGNHTEESGAAAARLLLSEADLPTAVLAGNDRCAVGLLDSLARSRVDVPGEVSVVGYDDSPIAQWSHIDLTTVRQNVPRMAEVAVRTAIERLDDHSRAGTEVVLDPELVVRGTTAAQRG
jgi:DNA-binding LacI/PurR family transcriptional regulator